MPPIAVHGVICDLQLSAYYHTIIFMTQRTPKNVPVNYYAFTVAALLLTKCHAHESSE